MIPGMHVVVVGDPFDGMSIYGPFPTGDEANDWAQCNGKTDLEDVDWWVVRLESPLPDECEEGEFVE